MSYDHRKTDRLAASKVADDYGTAFAKDQQGEFYADFDHNTGLWGVFGTESGFCYETYGDESGAEREADRMTWSRRQKRLSRAKKRLPLR